MVDEEAEVLTDAVNLADALLTMVIERAPEVVTSRDRNDLYVAVVFAQAFRLLRSVRHVVFLNADADGALLLTRSMVSMLIRAHWLIETDDDQERKGRLKIFNVHSFKDGKRTDANLEARGMTPSLSQEQWSELIGETGNVSDMPSDFRLANDLGHGQLYDMVYRPASAVTHFSVTALTESFDMSGVPEGALPSLEGLPIRFQEGQPVRAAHALKLACVTYVGILEVAELVVKHGITEDAKKLVWHGVVGPDTPMPEGVLAEPSPPADLLPPS